LADAPVEGLNLEALLIKTGGKEIRNSLRERFKISKIHDMKTAVDYVLENG
jgi:hypothetical protein